jgi:ABC-2 type transport system permease protein
MNWSRTLTVARTDLKQLMQSRDFWGPMVILGALFFVVLPAILLTMITQMGSVDRLSSIAETLDVLPIETQEQLQGTSPEGRTGYALAVFLFAPVAVVLPLTISTAVGAATIVGEREKGTGEFLANSPAGVREIYIGKLLASLIPGYVTTAVGFGLYSIVVNLTVGPEVGGWFFPTAQWWVMILWVLPPFLAICLSLVLRLSAKVKSTAAAQQASGLISLPLIMLAYGQATGVLLGASWVPLVLGGVAWLIALISLSRGVRSVTRARLLGVA